MYEDRPWLRFYGKVPTTLAYPEVTLYEALAVTARRVPEAVAWDFFGTQSIRCRVWRQTVGRGKYGLATTSDQMELAWLLKPSSNRLRKSWTSLTLHVLLS